MEERRVFRHLIGEFWSAGAIEPGEVGYILVLGSGKEGEDYLTMKSCIVPDERDELP